MSPKDFLVLIFIILYVEVACPSEKQNNYARIDWNNQFIFSFFPTQINQDWENEIRKMVNGCVWKNCAAVERERCKGPSVNITFPLISWFSNLNFSLEPLHRPVLAMIEPSSSTSRHVLQALQQIWQLFALSIMAAVLSGIVIWFLVSQ